ncbi:MAG: hypothetical protein JWP54_699, partial [Cryobacterium sp.]|nr:hypothetical protein [Cryobacterium sp.]
MHHRLKHHTLWAVEQEPGGVLVWTSPAGQTHRTYPDTYLGPPVTQASEPEAPTSPAAPRPDNLPEQPSF